MGICPLTQRMCLFCDHNFQDVVCMEGDQIRKIKDLGACPQQPFRLLRTVGEASKQPH
jgi:hypothetical protein